MFSSSSFRISFRPTTTQTRQLAREATTMVGSGGDRSGLIWIIIVPIGKSHSHSICHTMRKNYSYTHIHKWIWLLKNRDPIVLILLYYCLIQREFFPSIFHKWMDGWEFVGEQKMGFQKYIIFKYEKWIEIKRYNWYSYSKGKKNGKKWKNNSNAIN